MLFWPVVLLAVVTTTGCALMPGEPTAESTLQGEAESEDADEPLASVQEADTKAPLPKIDLTESLLFEYLLAEIAGQRGGMDRAAQTYLDLARQTRDPRIARRATEIALYARMNGIAIDAARIWYETDPESERPLQALAGLLVASGSYAEALPYLKKLLASPVASPENGFAQLTRTLASAKDKRAALALVQQLAAGHDKLAQGHFAVAQAAANAGDDGIAAAEARRAGELQPAWDAPVLLESQLLLKKSPQDAAGLLAAYLGRNPGAREARLGYARTLVALKRFAEAREEFRKLMSGVPDNTEVAFAVAVLSIQLKDYDAAEGYLKRLLDSPTGDKDGVRLYLGQVAEERKNYSDALHWYGQIAEGEQHLTAQIRYAQVLAKQGNLGAARTYLQSAAKGNGQQGVPLVLAEAQILRDANQPKTAFDLVGQALDRLPNNPDLLYDYAMLAEKIERVDVLEASLRKLIEIRPDNAHAYNALGYSLADRNQRLREARELIERALQLAPDDFFIIDSMGWVLFRMGNLKDAVTQLRRAFAGRPDPEIAAHLGEALWAAGERDEAERVLGEAARSSPDNETLANTIKRLKR